jgi:hypothetical protein
MKGRAALVPLPRPAAARLAPPHDPADRICVAVLASWEVRIFHPAGRMHRYFAPRGLLHLQLWECEKSFSLLTPSRLTAGRYEAFPVRGWKLSHRCLETLQQLIPIELPDAALIRAWEREYVELPARFEPRSDPDDDYRLQ